MIFVKIEGGGRTPKEFEGKGYTSHALADKEIAAYYK